jgi:hypothetical protein
MGMSSSKFKPVEMPEAHKRVLFEFLDDMGDKRTDVDAPAGLFVENVEEHERLIPVKSAPEEVDLLGFGASEDAPRE